MKVKVRGKNEVQLNKNDFVVEGGEGQIFIKSGLVYKIYTDTSKIIPEGKIQELQVLDRDNIIIPLEVLIGEKGKMVGFTMKEVKSSCPLCQLFTTAFRNRNGITENSTLKLIESLQQDIEFIHSRKCLIVDVNELNFLVDNKKYEKPYFIDTNSYKTPSFPPTAIMPSIRDWASSDFSPLTDWFSFGILAFQLFVGIHPYKGKHPDYSGKDLVQRMKDGVSVFNSKVSIPAATRDFSYIPSEYMSWFKKLFVEGKRVLPPTIGGYLHVVQVSTAISDNTSHFFIQLEKSFDSEILGHKVLMGKHLTLTKKKFWADKIAYNSTSSISIIVTPKQGHVVSSMIEDKMLKLRDMITGQELKGVPIQAEDKIVVENNLYVKNQGMFLRVIFIETNSSLLYSTEKVCDIMERSSMAFSGMIYENVLGKAYLVIPHKDNEVYTIPVKELDGYRIIDAQYERQVAIVIGYKSGVYDKFIFRFDDRFQYDCKVVNDISGNEINFVVLDNGMVVMISEDGILEMFTNRPASSQWRVIKDPDIHSDMHLCRDGQKVLFFKDNSLYNLKLQASH